MNPNIISGIIYLTLLWVPSLMVIELEWRYNEQYNYGYFVPLFTLYLIYIRWRERPATSESTFPTLALFTVATLLIPFQLIETANPDWRFIYWVIIVTALITTILIVDQVGGKSWVKHFLPAMCMILFSVPWFMRIENVITSRLMDIVASFTVEVINMSGIYAVKMGNVIRLPDTFVGIEEACSGVRSLQSSLMAGYLFGEILRFKPPFRLGLVALSIGLTFLLNLIRTISLTLITHNLGNTGYDKWHDPLGNAVAIIGFLGIALIAWTLSKTKSSIIPEKEESPQTKDYLPRSIKLPTIISLCLVLSLPIAIDPLWYSVKNSTPTNELPPINWAGISDELLEIEIDPITKAQLKYTEGMQFAWRGQDRSIWTAFYFSWKSGTISSYAGVHRPENCLPAAGMTLVEVNEEFNWDGPSDIKIPVRLLTFKNHDKIVYVFFSVWDAGGIQPWFSYTWLDRFKDVLKRRVVDDRYSLEFICEGANDITLAKKEFIQYLDQIYKESTIQLN